MPSNQTRRSDEKQRRCVFRFVEPTMETEENSYVSCPSNVIALVNLLPLSFSMQIRAATT